MISCSSPSNDDVLLYDEVVACRDSAERDRLNEIAEQVKEAYTSYDRAGMRITGLASVIEPEEDRALLEENWTPFGRVAFQTVKTGIFKASSGLCCLCGHAKAGEIDHYLPKARFPEFTVYTPNLLAACRRCNGKKSANYLRSDKAPAFLHPYLHHLPDEQFLQIDIEIAATVLLAYKVVQTANMSDARFGTLRSHFRKLALGRYYEDEAVRVLGEQLHAFYAYHRDTDDGGASVARYLSREANTQQAKYGRNHWKVVLLRGLAGNADFCDRGFEILGPEPAL